MSGLRGTRSLVSRFITARRWNSTQASPSGPTMPKDETGNSFRPNWAHLGSGVVSYMVIPAVGAYAVFFWDFGEREHVFQPARRWVARNINRFFSLSPEEKLVVFKDDAEPPVEGTSMST